LAYVLFEYFYFYLFAFKLNAMHSVIKIATLECKILSLLMVSFFISFSSCWVAI